MEKISYTDRVRNVEFSLFLRVKYERNMLHRIKRIKANLMGCIFSLMNVDFLSGCTC